jgi:hypothetical protein
MSDAYDRLLAAAASLVGAEIFRSDNPPTAEAAEDYLRANHAALDAARSALAGACAAAIGYSQDFYTRYSIACQELLKLGESFCLAVQQAERAGDFDSAVREGVAALDVANALRRGGLVIGRLVGNLLEGTAIGRLRKLHRRLNASTARQLARVLLRIDAEREPFDAIATRDAGWSQRAGMPNEPADFLSIEWPDEVRGDLSEEDEWALRSAMQDIADLPDDERNAFQRRLDDRGLALLRLLAIETALVAHVREHGVHPRSLAELVPGVLAAVPPDPFTQEALRYFSSEDECIVYSPGPTGVDHSGNFGCWFDVESGAADLCLAMHDFDCGD